MHQGRTSITISHMTSVCSMQNYINREMTDILAVNESTYKVIDFTRTARVHTPNINQRLTGTAGRRLAWWHQRGAAELRRQALCLLASLSYPASSETSIRHYLSPHSIML